MNEQLQTDKQQQETNTRLQISEPVGHSCQEEEHGSQTKNGKDVGEEHYIWIERHREHSRNTVESKNQIAELYHQHGDYQGL